jgi:hypothetical protein
VTLFGLPDFLSDWKNAKTTEKTVLRVLVLASSWWAGFSVVGGSAFVAGAHSLVGIGAGMLSGGACFVMAARHVGLPIAFPQSAYDELAKTVVVDDGVKK